MNSGANTEQLVKHIYLTSSKLFRFQIMLLTITRGQAVTVIIYYYITVNKDIMEAK